MLSIALGKNHKTLQKGAERVIKKVARNSEKITLQQGVSASFVTASKVVK